MRTQKFDNFSKAVISLSGGLDSTCLLLHLLAKGCEIRAYSFQYGQRHQIELTKVQNNIAFLQSKGYNITHEIIDVTSIFAGNTSSLISSTGTEIPEGNYDEDNMRSTVVPLRNVIFSSIIYSKAINWAVQSQDNVVITLGIHAGDHIVYPDCRPESHDACKRAFEISDWNSNHVDYIAPFEMIDKAEVLESGLNAMRRMGLTDAEQTQILTNTHTCYNPNEAGESCGKCGSCHERLEAFAKNGITDPITYQQEQTEETNEPVEE